jgi:hypothetical protein
MLFVPGSATPAYSWLRLKYARSADTKRKNKELVTISWRVFFEGFNKLS